MSHPPSKGLHILVVEDNTDCATSTAVLLRMYGHEVEVALSGADAMKSVQSRRPDVVLLDIGLPQMDGYEVARRLRQLGGDKALFLIAVSGWGPDRQRTAEAGIDVHLLKPVGPEYLRSILARFAAVSQ
jgi:CheY-like chemotaxis protein